MQGSGKVHRARRAPAKSPAGGACTNFTAALRRRGGGPASRPATWSAGAQPAPPSPGVYGLRYTFRQILWVEDGEPDWLDEQEQAYVAAVCADLGFDVEEHDYDERGG